MQVIHESGHAFAALATGGTIRKVVLVPWELSRSDLIKNPSPLFVCWAGPITGAIAPVVIWLVSRGLNSRAAFWFQFLAGFCLIANGAYIGVGAWTADGDAGDLIRLETPQWTMVAFALITSPFGFWLWHGLGPQFGFGKDAKPISWTAALTSFFVLAIIAIVEIICE